MTGLHRRAPRQGCFWIGQIAGALIELPIGTEISARRNRRNSTVRRSGRDQTAITGLFRGRLPIQLSGLE